MSDGLFPWIAHVASGAGVLVSPRRVLTAAHTVRNLASVKVLFPGNDVSTEGSVRRAPDTRCDLAVIELQDNLDLTAAPFRPSALTNGHSALVPGNLTDNDEIHRVARVRVVGDAGDGSVQIDVDSRDGYAIVSGHSGSPVIDERLGAVIGICRTKETHSRVKVGSFIRIETAAQQFPELAPWLGWRLSEERADTAERDLFAAIDSRLRLARKLHWYPRALGTIKESTGSSVSLFAGREAAVGRIRDWALDAAPGVLFVTGDPGAGKSAVVANALVRADPGPSQPTGPTFRYAFHARHRSVDELSRSVSDALGGRSDAGTEEALELVARHRALIAVDGLDEAQDGASDAIVSFAQSVAAAGGRALVGARRSLVPSTVGLQPIDLDDDAYFQHADLVNHCSNVLQRLDQPAHPNVWRGAPETPAVAEEIAQQSGRNFLVATMVALEHSISELPSPRSARSGDVRSAFNALLDTIDEHLGWKPL